jgi:hypothetical protein
LTKIFFYSDFKIHTPIESPSRVYSKYVLLRNIYSDVWSKKLRNSVKIRIF